MLAARHDDDDGDRSLKQVLSVYTYVCRRIPHGVEINVLDGDIAGIEFELQLYYYVHIRTNTLKEGMTPLYPTIC